MRPTRHARSSTLRRNLPSSKAALDWSRVDTACRLFALGATEGPGAAGQVQLTMPDGSFGMLTSAAVVKAAKAMGQGAMEGGL